MALFELYQIFVISVSTHPFVVVFAPRASYRCNPFAVAVEEPALNIVKINNKFQRVQQQQRRHVYVVPITDKSGVHTNDFVGTCENDAIFVALKKWSTILPY